MRLGSVVTDLDGTLLGSSRTIGAADRQTLIELGERGVLRVVATGRSLFSARTVLGADFPIDFLIHSSGAGTVSWPEQRPVRALHMAPPSALRLVHALWDRDLDFMLHHAIPDNHRFAFRRSTRANADFERRLTQYAAHAEPLREPLQIDNPMCQALVIESASRADVHAQLVQALTEWSVLRATSPLDGCSTWVEIFPRGVCKSAAAAWLREARGLLGTASLAVGNDYNDVDLLDWAEFGCVVANAPEALRARYRSVASHDAGGFSEAVRHALAQSSRD
jgi:HAD superfamily hydrolase (TIGR01484 family)